MALSPQNDRFAFVAVRTAADGKEVYDLRTFSALPEGAAHEARVLDEESPVSLPVSRVAKVRLVEQVT
jgi:hypothetical protein